MTTEQQPPPPQEHRRSRWWPFESVVGRPPFEPVEPDGGPAADGPSPTDPPAPSENGSVIHGEVVSDEQLAAHELAHEQEQAADQRLPLPPTFRQELRMQLADFAERAHQKRLNPDSAELLGSGGGITEAVVEAMARAISTQNLRGPAGSDEDRTDLLLGALAATDPTPRADAGHVSFVTLRGRLMLDVSTAAIDGESLDTRFVRLPSRSTPTDEDNAPHAAAPDRGHASSPRYAAVICGPAGVIANGRPFLGMDALTTFARRQAYLNGNNDGSPEAAGNGMRAAHNIEVVVLLDPSLGGGVWVDVDPATGSPAAAMSIDVKPAGFRFTPLAAA